MTFRNDAQASVVYTDVEFLKKLVFRCARNQSFCNQADVQWIKVRRSFEAFRKFDWTLLMLKPRSVSAVTSLSSATRIPSVLRSTRELC